jgi:hypothetical protein
MDHALLRQPELTIELTTELTIELTIDLFQLTIV